MGITDILGQKHIIPEMQAADRWEAIDELVGSLVAAGKIKPEDRDCVAAVVKKRELSNSTGFGLGVAFPTASCDAIDSLLVAVGRSRKGIEFDSLDEQPVKLIMLVLVPAGQYQKYATLAQALVNLFYSLPFRQTMETAADAAAICSLFCQHEKHLVPVKQD